MKQKTLKSIFATAFLLLLSSCFSDNDDSENAENSTASSSSLTEQSGPYSSSVNHSSSSSANVAIAPYSSSEIQSNALVIDHRHAKLQAIPVKWIDSAITKLKVAYGHTSHGSQLLAGMRYLENTKGAPYYLGNTLGIQIASKPFDGPDDFDLGNPNRTDWAAATRKYLEENPDVNVVMWAWCIGVTSATEADIVTYLELMSGLETDFPHVQFVYMTGHLDGTGTTGNLHLRNEQIRQFVLENHKILYDFAAIESYDPDGVSYLEKYADDNCDYYEIVRNGSRGDSLGNWCLEWQDAHPGEWYEATAAHTQSLNANLKAYAAWYMFARLAGWDGVE